MGGAVPHDGQGVGIALSEDLHGVIAGELVGKVDKLAIDPPHHRGGGEALADALGQLGDGRTVGELLDAAIGESNGCHSGGFLFCRHHKCKPPGRPNRAGEKIVQKNDKNAGIGRQTP